jgi:hypothetical protein
LLQSFRRLGTAGAVVKAFRDAKLLFPHRPPRWTTRWRVALGPTAHHASTERLA